MSIVINLQSSTFECDDCFGKVTIKFEDDILQKVKQFVCDVDEFLLLNKISYRCLLVDHPVNEYLFLFTEQADYSSCWPLMSKSALNAFIKELSLTLHPFEIDNPLYQRVDDELIQLSYDFVDQVKSKIIKKKELCQKIVQFADDMEFAVYPFYLICKHNPVAICNLIDKQGSCCIKCSDLLVNELTGITKAFFEPLSLQILVLTELKYFINFTQNYNFLKSINDSFFCTLKGYIDFNVMSNFEKMINLLFFVDENKINDFKDFFLKLISNPYSQKKIASILDVFTAASNVTANLYRGKILQFIPSAFLHSLFTHFLEECVNISLKIELQKKAFLSLSYDSSFERQGVKILIELAEILTQLDSISIAAHSFVFLENYRFLDHLPEKKAKRLRKF